MEVANENRSISIIPQGSWTPGNPSYIENIASKKKINNKGILLDSISWNITGCTQGSYNGGGSGVINGSSQKTKIDGFKIMRKDDSGYCSGTLVFKDSFISCTCEFKITNTGQGNVKAL